MRVEGGGERRVDRRGRKRGKAVVGIVDREGGTVMEEEWEKEEYEAER